jgi:hypothetical protein
VRTCPQFFRGASNRYYNEIVSLHRLLGPGGASLRRAVHGFSAGIQYIELCDASSINTKADSSLPLGICENDLRVIRPDNETRSVAMRVNNPERSTLGING